LEERGDFLLIRWVVVVHYRVFQFIVKVLGKFGVSVDAVQGVELVLMLVVDLIVILYDHSQRTCSERI
jgi:hypothetical protein